MNPSSPTALNPVFKPCPRAIRIAAHATAFGMFKRVTAAQPITVTNGGTAITRTAVVSGLPDTAPDESPADRGKRLRRESNARYRANKKAAIAKCPSPTGDD